MIRDRFRFNRELHGKNSRGNLAEKIKRSVLLAQKRQVTRPICSYPEILPITGKVREISEAIENNQVVILAGETGSGKTTQQSVEGGKLLAQVVHAIFNFR